MSSVTAETLLLSYTNLSPSPHEAVSDRRADVDAKQAHAAALLQEAECEGLLLLDPDHFTWRRRAAGSSPGIRNVRSRGS